MANGDNIGLHDEGFGACNPVATANLWKILEGGNGAADLEVAARDSKAHEDMDGDAELGQVDFDTIARDYASLFEAVNALGDCRCRKADLPTQLGE
jgi:hypothetical protein